MQIKQSNTSLKVQLKYKNMNIQKKSHETDIQTFYKITSYLTNFNSKATANKIPIQLHRSYKFQI